MMYISQACVHENTFNVFENHITVVYFVVKIFSTITTYTILTSKPRYEVSILKSYWCNYPLDITEILSGTLEN